MVGNVPWSGTWTCTMVSHHGHIIVNHGWPWLTMQNHGTMVSLRPGSWCKRFGRESVSYSEMNWHAGKFRLNSGLGQLGFEQLGPCYSRGLKSVMQNCMQLVSWPFVILRPCNCSEHTPSVLPYGPIKAGYTWLTLHFVADSGFGRIAGALRTVPTKKLSLSMLAKIAMVPPCWSEKFILPASIKHLLYLHEQSQPSGM